jgi:hypothetical protein
MVAPHTTHTGDGKGSPQSLLRTLDDLALLTDVELGDLFASASAPKSLAALDGDLTGRMLAVRHVRHGRLFRGLAAVAKARHFPWAGKTFESTGKDTGRGKNRVRAGRTLDLVPFTTRFGASALDGRPSVILDYGLTPIHDELREVGPSARGAGTGSGLFFGPACLKRAFGRPVVLAWFAVARAERS